MRRDLGRALASAVGLLVALVVRPMSYGEMTRRDFFVGEHG